MIMHHLASALDSTTSLNVYYVYNASFMISPLTITFLRAYL